MPSRPSNTCRRNGRDAPDGAMTLEARREGSVTVIEVSDNGPGIPEQIRERSCFRPSRVLARQGGTGLGLAIAAELVRAHGGDIQLQSSSGAGTCLSSPFPTRSPSCGRGRGGTARFRSRPSLLGKTCVARRGVLRKRQFPQYCAPVAQLDRAPDYESGGQEFESLRARQIPPFAAVYTWEPSGVRQRSVGGDRLWKKCSDQVRR